MKDIKVDKALAERPQFAVIKVACKVWRKSLYREALCAESIVIVFVIIRNRTESLNK